MLDPKVLLSAGSSLCLKQAQYSSCPRPGSGPFPPPLLLSLGLSAGLRPLGAYQVCFIHWAALYEMGLSWRQRVCVWGKRAD